MGQFVGCIEGMAEACAALDFPIVSGNVSLYNETKAEDGSSQAILPTPAIGGVGLIEQWEKAVGIGFKGPGDVIVTIGERHGHLGQSLWLREIHGLEGRDAGPPPPVDLHEEKIAGEFVRAAIAGGAITACHDISDGGLAVALAEMALAGNVGALINGPAPFGHAGYFAEDQGVYVATVCDSCLLDLPDPRPCRGRPGRGDRPDQGQPADLRAARRRLCGGARRAARRARGLFPGAHG